MRRCVWSRNLTNEETMAQVGPQRHRKKKIWLVILGYEIAHDDLFFIKSIFVRTSVTVCVVQTQHTERRRSCFVYGRVRVHIVAWTLANLTLLKIFLSPSWKIQGHWTFVKLRHSPFQPHPFQLILLVDITQSAPGVDRFSEKSRSRLKILVARRVVTCSKSRSEELQCQVPPHRI